MYSTVDSDLLTLREAADFLNVSTATVRRRIADGSIMAAQLGGPGTPLRIPAASLRAWLWAEPRSNQEHA
jgi:excisionase family DNA binding protein